MIYVNKRVWLPILGQSLILINKGLNSNYDSDYEKTE